MTAFSFLRIMIYSSLAAICAIVTIIICKFIIIDSECSHVGVLARLAAIVSSSSFNNNKAMLTHLHGIIRVMSEKISMIAAPTKIGITRAISALLYRRFCISNA